MDFFYYWLRSRTEGEIFTFCMTGMMLNLFLAFIAGHYLGHHQLKYPRQARIGWLLAVITGSVWGVAAVVMPVFDGNTILSIITLASFGMLTFLAVGAGIIHWYFTKHKRRRRRRTCFQPQILP